MNRFAHDFFDLYNGLLAILDFDRQFLEVNPQWELRLGWTADDLKNRSINDLIHPEESAQIQERLVNGKRDANFIFQCRLKNRESGYNWFEIQFVSRPERSSFYIIGKDINESKFLAQKLYEIAQGVPGLIYQFLMTPEGETSMPYLAVEGLRYFELSEQDYLQDKNILMKMVHPDDQPALIADIQRSAKELSPFQWTGRMKLKSGQIKWFNARSLPKCLSDGSITWNGVLTDVTYERELEIALDLERAKSVQTAKLASVGEMSAGIAHEINNPLAIIQGAASTLLKVRDDPEKFQKRVDSILKSGDRISKIVSGLRKFSRTTSSEDREWHSPARIMDEVATLTNHRAKKSDVKIDFEIKTDASIYCNEIEMEQVLVNLINNGIDAAKEMQERWVRVIVFEEKNDVVFHVLDSGKGVLPEIKGKIFNPFFTTKKVGEGTGLGMSIAQGIVKSHNGKIQLLNHSSPTCFEIRLPKHSSQSESEVS